MTQAPTAVAHGREADTSESDARDSHAHHTTVESTPKGATRRNVLLIIADDLNTDIGCYGDPLVQTPNIDRLAEQGMRFDRAYCQYPLCGPSRNSMMTGLYVPQTNTRPLRELLRDHVPNAVTVSQHFMAHGYTAARVGKIYHYNNPSGVGTWGHDDPSSWNIRIAPRGIDKDIEDNVLRVSHLRDNVANENYLGGQISWLAAPGPDEAHTDGKVATETIRLLDRFRERDEPFFLAMGLFRPHTPFVAPTKYFDLYNPEDIVVPEVDPNVLAAQSPASMAMLRSVGSDNDMPEDLARQAIHAYHASVSFADAQIGRVMDHLHATGMDQNTIVLFTSDHGYHLGEKGHYQKKTLFDRGSRVPLIVAAPGMQAPGQHSLAPAELTDVYRTLSDLAGLDAPMWAQGVSLAPVLNDPDARPRDAALAQINTRVPTDNQKHDHHAITVENWRLVQHTPTDQNHALALYNLAEDPQESNNLAADPAHQAILAMLQAKLNKHVVDAYAPHGYPAADQRLPFGGRPWPLPGPLEAEFYDHGGEGVGYHERSSSNGSSFDQWFRPPSRPEQPVPQTEPTRAPDANFDGSHASTIGHHIGRTEDGEWLAYTVDWAPGTHVVTAQMASPHDNPGRLHLLLNGEPIGSLPAHTTGGWQAFETSQPLTVTIQDTGQPQILQLRFERQQGFNFDRLDVRPMEPATHATQSAATFLNLLTASQREQTQRSFGDPLRVNWHFVPKAREGVAIKALDDDQLEALFALLKAGLSEAGMAKVSGVMTMESVLAEMENNPRYRDAGKYHILVFGNPGDTAWSWRFEGHHVSISHTVIDDENHVSITPSFIGANPHQVPAGPHQGMRLLSQEEDLARQLFSMLSEEQRELALLKIDAPADILTGNQSTAAPPPLAGVPANRLNQNQQEALWQLIDLYLNNHRPDAAKAMRQRIQEAGFENVHFAWAGSDEPGKPHYYRVHGPTFLIEYDNTQNQANHSHTVLRDLENDFGRDWLREHLQHGHGE